jgi:alpha-ketoglutarate-dependent taurine dioxygenase
MRRRPWIPAFAGITVEKRKGERPVRFDVEQIKPKIGAIIHTDKESLHDEAVAKRCLDLLDDRIVLVFPRIGLTDEEQLAFTDRLGSRVAYSSHAPGQAGANRDIYAITLDPDINDQPEYVHANFFWHWDGSHGHLDPPRATILSARSVSPKGGQTEFANTYAGYESLSDTEKQEIEGLRVVHSLFSTMRKFIDDPSDDHLARWTRSVMNTRGKDESAVADDPVEKQYPLVWTHRNGRKSLVLGTSADYVVGMPVPHGRALIARLLDWTVQPNFRYRHHWQEGDLLLWNNTAALHRVLPYDGKSGRRMHRTTLAGLEPVN